jgi:CheY-like chemotaxis protein
MCFAFSSDKSTSDKILTRSERLEVLEKSSKNLLLIDDDHDIRDLLASVLRAEGYSVETAANGHEGLSKLRMGFTGIVLVDFMMPVMNGEQFLEAIQEDPALKQIPVMMISASGTVENGRLARQFIAKPFDIHFLLESLSKHAS